MDNNLNLLIEDFKRLPRVLARRKELRKIDADGKYEVECFKCHAVMHMPRDFYDTVQACPACGFRFKVPGPTSTIPKLFRFRFTPYRGPRDYDAEQMFWLCLARAIDFIEDAVCVTYFWWVNGSYRKDEWKDNWEHVDWWMKKNEAITKIITFCIAFGVCWFTFGFFWLELWPRELTDDAGNCIGALTTADMMFRRKIMTVLMGAPAWVVFNGMAARI